MFKRVWTALVSMARVTRVVDGWMFGQVITNITVGRMTIGTG